MLTLPRNQSKPSATKAGSCEHGSDTNLLVSPLLVAGVVIGLVLFLSCTTIVVGSLRKDSRLGQPRLPREAADGKGEGPGNNPGRRRSAANINSCFAAPDGFSHGGSSAELRSTCTEEFPPACDFDSYLDILSQVNIMYPDPPPCYDECVGPGATQIYIPADDPPPYSLTDPCQRNEIPLNICISQEEEAAGTAGRAAHCAVRLQDWQQPSSGISVISQCGGCSPLHVLQGPREGHRNPGGCFRPIPTHGCISRHKPVSFSIGSLGVTV
uniref:BEAN1 n=1 Tax=Catharus ustulatus TaxID=91951 RepID=A0A8C3UHA8_CATUS